MDNDSYIYNFHIVKKIHDIIIFILFKRFNKYQSIILWKRFISTKVSYFTKELPTKICSCNINESMYGKNSLDINESPHTKFHGY